MDSARTSAAAAGQSGSGYSAVARAQRRSVSFAKNMMGKRVDYACRSVVVEAVRGHQRDWIAAILYSRPYVPNLWI
jgi:hypothetical protein